VIHERIGVLGELHSRGIHRDPSESKIRPATLRVPQYRDCRQNAAPLVFREMVYVPENTLEPPERFIEPCLYLETRKVGLRPSLRMLITPSISTSS